MVIILLITSPLLSASGEKVSINLQNEISSTFVEPSISGKSTGPQITKHFTVRIDERESYHFSNNGLIIDVSRQPIVEHLTILEISEHITFSNNDGTIDQIYLVKHRPTHAILESILNYNRFTIDNLVGLPITIVFFAPLYYDFEVFEISGVAEAQLNHFYHNTLHQNILQDLDAVVLQPVLGGLVSQSIFEEIDKQLGITIDSFEQQSVTLLFFFASISLFVIVRSEYPKIIIQNYNRAFSFVFVVLLVSSIIVTPLSISESYYAHSEPGENINSTEDLVSKPPFDQMSALNTSDSALEQSLLPSSSLNVTEYISETQSQSNSTLEFENKENRTIPIIANQTIQNNSTTQVPYTNETNGTPVQTFLSLIENLGITWKTTSTADSAAHAISQTVMYLMESLGITWKTSNKTGSTTPVTNNNQTNQFLTEDLGITKNTTIPTNPIIPDASRSWTYDSNATDSKLMGDIYVNQTEIVLGGGYIKSADNTNQTSSFAVTAWIKPNYSSGSSTFTILSKDRSFELTLNNILYPEHVATFSVFDGIKWHSVQTSTDIGQGWSHVAATFNGTEISIYLNGTLSRTAKTDLATTVDSLSGRIQNTTPEISARDSEIVIGATLHSRTVDTAQRTFSGSLDKVEVYDKYLTADQILALYQRTLPSILAKSIPIEPAQTELPPLNLLNHTGVNGTLNTTATEYVTVPSISQTNRLTISVWVDPDYSNSDELTILSKDRSFSLSLNNVFSPQHTAKFSVFDGIKWTEIQDTSKIEDMSHLAAVINRTEISLYVNGTLQERKTLPNSFSVSKGELVTSEGVVNPATDVVIGAYISASRTEPKLSNKFSGTIEDAIIYNRVLKDEEIKELYYSQTVTEPRPPKPLFAEDILSFIDIITLMHYPREPTVANSADSIEESLGFGDTLSLVLNGLDQTANSTEDATKFGEGFGIADSIELQKSTPPQRDHITYEERGRDYHKVEYANGTGKITFGLPEWILDSKTGKYVEHIITELDGKLIYDSRQIPFVFDKNDCSIRIYEKGGMGHDSQIAIGREHWKLMESQAGSQWTDSQINNKTCNVQIYENATGFYINALREDKDGRFLITYAKKTDEPLESFLYYTNTNENRTSTKFGFVQELEGIESDEVTLGNQIITSKLKTANKLTENGIKPHIFTDNFEQIKELGNNEKISKKKTEIVSEAIHFKRKNHNPLILDFSKAANEFSNLKVENNNGKLQTTLEFLSVNEPLKNGETLFLDPTITIGGQTFVQANAQGTGTSCPTPSNISQSNSTSNTLVSRQSSETGCERTSREFDIGSKIDSRAIITDVTTFLDVLLVADGGRSCEIRSMEIQPTSHTTGGTEASPNPDAQTLWNDIGDGTAYATAVTCNVDGSVNLGASAVSDLQTAIDVGQNWFAIGLKLEDETRPTGPNADDGSVYSSITLSATYFIQSELSENLGIRDSISTSKSTTKQLTENLGLKDNDIALAKTKTLAENLGMRATMGTVAVITQPLTENLGMVDTIAVSRSATQPLTENLGITDTAGTTRSATQPLTENLGIADGAATTATKTQLLTENLGITDGTSTTSTTTHSLTENLGMVDTIAVSRSAIEALTENLGITDVAAKTTARTNSLTENLGLTDTLDTRRTFTQPLTENLGMVDTIAVSRSATQPLTESLGFTDQSSTTAAKTRLIAENLGITDVVAKTTARTHSLTENLGMVDTIAVSRSATQPLTENLGITDTLDTRRTFTQSLTENLGIADEANATAEKTKALAENLGMTGITDTMVAKTHSLTENLGFIDTITTTRIVMKSLTENVGIIETVNSTIAKTHSLTENLGVMDSVTTTAAITHSLAEHLGITDVTDKTTARTRPLTENLGITDTLDTRRTFTQSLTENFGFTDQSSTTATKTRIVTENLGIADGAATTATKTQLLTENLGITEGTSTTVATTHSLTENLGMVDTIAVSRSATQPLTENLGIADGAATTATKTQLLTESLGITDTAGTTRSSTQPLTENLGITDTAGTTRSATHSLTENLGIADEANATAEKTKALAENLGMTGITDTMVAKTHSLTENLGMMDSVTTTAAITHSIAESLGITDNTDNVVVKTKALAESLGMRDTMGTVATITRPLTENLGITDTAGTTRSATHSLTESLGFTDQSSTTAAKTRLIDENLGIAGSTDTMPVKTHSLTENLGMTDSITTPAITRSLAENLGMTDTVSVSRSANSPPNPATPTPPPAIAGGSGGGGGSAGATTVERGFEGRLAQPIIIYEIRYDVCEQNMVNVVVGVTGSELPPPNVTIRTSIKEIYSAKLAKDQPYTQANKILPISRYVYETNLDPKLNFFIVTAEVKKTTDITATHLTTIGDECKKTIIVNPMTDLDGFFEPTLEIGKPKIFDIKLQVDDNKPTKATEINKFVMPDSKVRISAIVDSPSTIRRAELRVNAVGENNDKYAAIKMEVIPLRNIANAYVVSADLPTSFLQTPATAYWIHIINNEGKDQRSELYALGVKPSYKLDARVELTGGPSQPEDTAYRPTAFVYNNEEEPFFGSVSLLVDGKAVYTSPEQLFNKAKSVVELEWEIPELGYLSRYVIGARLNVYDKTIDTTQTILRTFQGTKIGPISEPIKVDSVTDEGEMVAQAGLLYSTNDNPEVSYKVISPDGTCVIGGSESCLVRDSTIGKRGSTSSVEIGGQIYRIRYLGEENPLERFSITSIEPIVGTWNVMLEADDGIIPVAQTLQEVHLKIKYSPTYNKLVTVSSE